MSIGPWTLGPAPSRRGVDRPNRSDGGVTLAVAPPANGATPPLSATKARGVGDAGARPCGLWRVGETRSPPSCRPTGRMSSVASTEVLGTYLNDHLAGANAGVEMAHRLHERAVAGPDAAALGRLAEEIEHDRNELRGLIERLGEAGHPVKKVAGWIAGKAHRLAVTKLLTRDDDLSMLLETETLALGVAGKLALWQALLAVAPAFPQLVEADLVRLAARAREQHSQIETIRLAAARRSFTPPS